MTHSINQAYLAQPTVNPHFMAQAFLFLLISHTDHGYTTPTGLDAPLLLTINACVVV
jgi:hypothetical protein